MVVIHRSIVISSQGLYTSGNETYNDVGQGLRKADIKSNDLGSTADDKALEEEQQGYDREGNKQPNFASSLVSTFDDNIATEHPTPQSPGDAKPILNQIPERVDQQNGRVRHDGDLGEDHLSESDPAETQVPHGSRELFGALADVSKGAQTDDRRLHARHGKDDSSQEEKAAVRVRSVLRKHLSIRVGAKPWTLPVPGPVVDPHGFEDPLCDEFFKDVWVAAAVHNVSFGWREFTHALKPPKTEIYRRVFHALPDDLVTTWKQYREFILHHERLQKPVSTVGRKGLTSSMILIIHCRQTTPLLLQTLLRRCLPKQVVMVCSATSKARVQIPIKTQKRPGRQPRQATKISHQLSINKNLKTADHHARMSLSNNGRGTRWRPY